MKHPKPRYSIRILWQDGTVSDPAPGLTDYQHALRRAKEFAQNPNVEGVWVITWKPSTVRKVSNAN